MSTPVTLTEAAATKVYQLLTDEGDYSLHLRAYIAGGGCSGFQYGFTFDPEKQDDDTCVEKKLDNGGSVTLLIDPISFAYLKGATIDYKQDAQGQRFEIQNPNAKTTCGCGSSFST